MTAAIVGVPQILALQGEPVGGVCTQIRRTLRGLLEEWGVDSATIADAVLVVEELVANVVDHARTRFQLLVRLAGPVLHIAVRDRSSSWPQVRPVDPHAVRGRGMQLVDDLAHHWGCEAHHNGKTVWADLLT